MLDAKFQSITNWPRKPTTARKNAPYRAGYKATLDLLDKELRAVQAKDVVIEAFFKPSQIRNDGWPRSDARPTQPGVVLRFHSKDGPIVMPSDKFSHWEDNLRAIGLTLEALRAVERHGATYDGQQYTGWKQLSSSADEDPVKQAARLLLEKAKLSGPLRKEEFTTVWRQAAANTHPDRGGSAEAFNAVTSARNLIQERLGW